MRTKTLALALAALLAAAPAAAETVQKLGFINTERVWRESRQAQNIQNILEKEFAARQKQLDKLQHDGLALEKQIAAKPAAKRTEAELQKLAEMGRRFRAEQAKFTEEFNLRRNEEFAALQRNANRVIFDLAKKEGYDLILQDVVFIDAKFDITDSVIREMNK